MSNGSFETIVIGGGGIGSPAAYWAAREGQGDVLLLEQFDLGHPNGASDDHSRIARYAQHTPGYATLVRSAIDTWKEVGNEAGEKLFVPTGELNLDTDLAYLQDVASSMDAAGTTYDRLGSEEVMREWPQFKNLDDGMHAIYQPDSGLVDARRANAAHIRLAREHGATVLDNTPATSVKLEAGSVVVSTAEGDFDAKNLVIATDAWTNRLLKPLGINLPLTVTKEQVIYYKPERPHDYSIGEFPIWLLHEGQGEHYYGFPVYGEQDATKAGIDVGGQTLAHMDERTFDRDPRITESVREMLSRFMPGFLGDVHREKTCIYTLTPDRDLVIDTIPGHPNVAVGLGAAHGFKYASLIGRILAQLSRGETPSHALGDFSLSRDALTNPAYKSALHFGSTVEHNKDLIVA